jgi:serine/threonine protein kinase/Tol biopolymer transport system component
VKLASGDRLGPYEIVSSIGAGGMGEVYRGRDTRLQRSVAIKILREELSGNSELRQRFDREARVVSQLDHPHICTVFDVGTHNGVDFMVMECLDGKTLAHRIGRGPLPISEVLTIAAQISAALDTAHRHGIIHRDLKPANIMLTNSGVKLMDFGLAKPLHVNALVAAASTDGGTVTADSPITSEGHVVGTFQYIAPEILQGGSADVRSDIFSFGCVLYEMITGTPPFNATSRFGVIAAILEKDPEPLTKWKPDTSPEIVSIVCACLAKVPDQRWQNVADVARALALTSREPVTRKKSLVTVLPWLFAVAALVVVAVLAILALSLKPSAKPFRRYTVNLPDSAPIAPAGVMPLGVGRPTLAVSKNGDQLVYVGLSGNIPKLFLRTNDDSPPLPLPGTEGAHSPFFSPDQKWIGFFADGKLKKVALAGGPVITISDAVLGFGAYWTPDDNIYFSAGERTPIFRVSASGGIPQEMTPNCVEAKLAGEYWPVVLPGGKGLVLANSRMGIVSFNFSSRKIETVTANGSYPRWSPTGHLLYVDDGLLWALPFDETTLRKTGAPKLLLDKVQMEQQGASQFDLSEEGSLFYVRGGDVTESSLVWVNSFGQVEDLGLAAHRFGEFRLSPDGKTVVVAINEQNRSDLWTYDLHRKTLSRLTDNGRSRAPVWSRTGDVILYASYVDPVPKLVEVTPDGSRTRIIAQTPGLQRATWYTSDGNIVMSSYDGNASVISFIDQSGNKTQIERSSHMRVFPAVSPDRRWLAFVSDETGRWEVYVRDLSSTRKWRITTEGGEEPIWERDGKNLFYRNGDRWMRVEIKSNPDFHASQAVPVLQGPYVNIPGYSYDVGADGRLLLLKSEYQDKKASQIEVIENWPALLNKTGN